VYIQTKCLAVVEKYKNVLFILIAELNQYVMFLFLFCTVSQAVHEKQLEWQQK
jgi:hypothetical protein